MTRARIEPRPRRELPDVALSFSELKYLLECPYQFKLRFLYGFNPPIHEALGYGKSVQDVLAEVHQRALDGDIVTDLQVSELVDRHLSVPFAYPALRDQLRDAARKAVHRYLKDNGDVLHRTLHTEQQVQVHIAPGITVDGRIDLIAASTQTRPRSSTSSRRSVPKPRRSLASSSTSTCSVTRSSAGSEPTSSRY